MTVERDPASPSAWLRSTGLDDTVAAQDPRQTVRQAGWGVQPPAPETLSEVRVTEREHGVTAEIVLGRELGRGGMGVVRRGTQAPLGREVAVKLLHADAGEAQRRGLAKEAMITGALEHPNITPVHLLARDESARPLLVTKLVQGVAWEDMLVDPQHPAWGAVAGDRLEWNLGVLLQVANALSFAHSRGVVHRDIKPENVMIGEYGEVYLLDWGIAVFADEIPQVREDVRRMKIAGTPAYMAPEMIDARCGDVGPHTDVFLLGGVLHRLLTGAPPNSGPDVLETLLAALDRAPFEYAPDVPDELAEIAQRALAPSPVDRFGSVEQLRRAVTDYLQSRGARRLCAHASAKLERLEDGALRDQPVETYRAFGACRFGFEEALALQPDLRPALDGLHRALRCMADLELSRENPSGAQVHIEELRALDPQADGLDALDARLARQLEEKAAARSELRRLARMEEDLDVDVGSRSRSLFALGFAAVFVLVGVLVLQAVDVMPAYPSLYTRLALLLGLVALGGLGRRRLLANTATRRLGAAALVLASAAVLHRVLTLRMDTPIDEVLTTDQLFGATGLGVMAVTIDKKLAPAALVLAAGALASALYPARVPGILAGALVAALGCLVVAWRFGAGVER